MNQYFAQIINILCRCAAIDLEGDDLNSRKFSILNRIVLKNAQDFTLNDKKLEVNLFIAKLSKENAWKIELTRKIRAE